jgi:altronate dehydratase small subunit
MGNKAIQIDERDNVATVTGDVEAGDQLEVISPDGVVILKLKVSEAIPFGHKLAIKPIKKGEAIQKYGEIIGVASKPIPAGAWVHTHNVESARLPSSGNEEGIL